jgi:hypothetical protein
MPGCNSLSEIMIGSRYKYYPVTHIRIMGIEENLINIILLKESLNSNGQHQLNKKSPLISPVCIYE